ncbi:sigma-70 family RNA polymerase sigma factor [Lapillicoccus sp.]|uniref:RNA polymerase sigma factor n=1 Tax=Lapillicoccus sp. TaxID=1909287 RepID=UPI00326485F1
MTEMDTSRGTLALAEALAGGSSDALSECYRLWGPLVLGIAARSLGSRVDAEDIVQQVFVSAWRSRGTLRPSQSALPAWLIGITRRRVADEYARRSRESAKATRAGSVLAVAGEEHTDPVDRVDAVVDRVVLRDALDQLPEPRRSVLNLIYLEDRTQEDIAERLDLPLGTVKSHVRRGLLHLRRELREVTDDPRS